LAGQKGLVLRVSDLRSRETFGLMSKNDLLEVILVSVLLPLVPNLISSALYDSYKKWKRRPIYADASGGGSSLSAGGGLLIDGRLAG
jgi:hypothetical protein